MMIIVNPVSANGRTGREWPGIAAELEKHGVEFECSFTTKAGEAVTLSRSAIQNGYRTVVAVGGDGTVNEVLNGFFDVNGQPFDPDARLGVISSGTGKDFIKSLGLSGSYSESAAVLARGTVRRIDIGRISYQDYEKGPGVRYFINVSGMGMDGETVARVNRTSKALGGRLSFLWGTLYTLVMYRNRDLKLEIDGVVCHHDKSVIAVVANGQYIGGGMRVAPHAEVDSGHFEVIAAGNIGKLRTLSLFARIYKGTHIGQPEVKTWRGSRIKATSSETVMLNIDGEQPGILDAEFTIVEHKLAVIC